MQYTILLQVGILLVCSTLLRFRQVYFFTVVQNFVIGRYTSCVQYVILFQVGILLVCSMQLHYMQVYFLQLVHYFLIGRYTSWMQYTILLQVGGVGKHLKPKLCILLKRTGHYRSQLSAEQANKHFFAEDLIYFFPLKL